MPQPKVHRDHAARQAAYRTRQAATRQKEQQSRGFPPLPPIPSIPGTARWRVALQHALSLAESVLQEMQDYYSDRTEAWQDSERGEAFQTRIDTIDELLGAMRDARAD